MPAELAEALNKKGGLTLTQLAIYDDICTDALVDRAYFWSTIRKVRPNARPIRGVREEDICKMLQEHVVINKDPIAAQKAVLALPGMRSYLNGLKTEDEKEHFERHMRKYINIWLPDCPFEVCTTHRYTITTAEACVIARKSIKAGEAVKFLAGIQVELTEEEEKGLSSRTDFSIVLSSRRKRPSLFLGPARFANHDCDSNARLTTTGPHGISIVACKNIAVGEEITVRYGENYFGEDNCECLCGTCERKQTNGWDPRGTLLREDTSAEEDEDEDQDTAEQRPRKRQRTVGIFDAVRSTAAPSPAPSKRRRDDAFVSARDSYSDLPVKRGRGRPRKHPLPIDQDSSKPQDVLESILKRTSRGVSYDKDFLTSYFEVRAKQEDVDADVALSETRRQIMNRGGTSRTKSKRWTESVTDDSKYLSWLGELSRTLSKGSTVHVKSLEPALMVLFKGLTEGTESDIKSMEEVLALSVQRSARSLGVSVEDVRHYWIDEDTRKAIPLPTRTRRPYRPSPSVSQPQPVEPQRPTAIERRATRIVVNGAPEFSTKHKQPTGSPLRKMVSIEQLDAEDATKGVSTSRNTSSSSKNRTSTAESTRSSVFSDNNAEPASPPSSPDDDSFAPGNICQNIVDMYTTGMDQEDDEDDKADNESDEDDEEERGEPRTPGDYHLCEALLIETNDRWVECRNCDEYFVQHDAYQTRIACPRCERHSKLYGYYWPKTDKAGANDKEERVLDHRLIHRFIDPEEEREEKKGRKSLAEVVRERDMSASQEPESHAQGNARDESRRRSRRLA